MAGNASCIPGADSKAGRKHSSVSNINLFLVEKTMSEHEAAYLFFAIFVAPTLDKQFRMFLYKNPPPTSITLCFVVSCFFIIFNKYTFLIILSRVSRQGRVCAGKECFLSSYHTITLPPLQLAIPGALV